MSLNGYRTRFREMTEAARFTSGERLDWHKGLLCIVLIYIVLTKGRGWAMGMAETWPMQQDSILMK